VFSSEINNCAWLATPAELDSATTTLTDAEITVNLGANNSTLRVATAENDAPSDVDFIVAIIC
jgi:hypothetical protein